MLDGIHCAFIGRVGQDAELRFTSSGTAFVSVSVLVQDSKAADGAGQWIRVGHFGEDAEELALQLTKGVECYIEGRLRLRTWQAADGTQRSGLDVTAWRLEPVGQIGRRSPGRSPEQRTAAVERHAPVAAGRPAQARYMEALDGA